MVRVLLYRGRDGSLSGFEVNGHASYAPHGEDIVCAAVSILAQTTALSLQKVVGIELWVHVEEGNLQCRLPDLLSEEEQKDANLLLNSMILGLEETWRSYPDYLEIKYK